MAYYSAASELTYFTNLNFIVKFDYSSIWMGNILISVHWREILHVMKIKRTDTGNIQILCNHQENKLSLYGSSAHKLLNGPQKIDWMLSVWLSHIIFMWWWTFSLPCEWELVICFHEFLIFNLSSNATVHCFLLKWLCIWMIVSSTRVSLLINEIGWFGD